MTLLYPISSQTTSGTLSLVSVAWQSCCAHSQQSGSPGHCMPEDLLAIPDPLSCWYARHATNLRHALPCSGPPCQKGFQCIPALEGSQLCGPIAVASLAGNNCLPMQFPCCAAYARLQPVEPWPPPQEMLVQRVHRAASTLLNAPSALCHCCVPRRSSSKLACCHQTFSPSAWPCRGCRRAAHPRQPASPALPALRLSGPSRGFLPGQLSLPVCGTQGLWVQPAGHVCG